MVSMKKPRKKVNFKRKAIFSIFSFLITVSCLALVIWQTIKCVSKYIEKPQGTILSIENTAHLPFPAITICSYYGYNKEVLEKCGISSSYANDAITKYRSGKWVGNENCSDPQKLFESAVYKLEDLMFRLQYKYFSNDVDDYVETNPTLPNELWSKTDSRGSDSESRGRCFTTIPINKHIKLGIQEITLTVGEYVNVYFHTPGMFITAKAKSEMLQGFSINEKSGGLYELDVKHDLYNVLGNDGAACNSDKSHSKDLCANENVEMKSMEEYGCHSPFGQNKTKICQDSDKVKQVLGIYTKEIEKHNSKCLNPCSFFSIMAMKTKNTKLPCLFGKCPKNRVTISFKENIKVTSGYYLYSGLSLVAEVGGYVGLFLGVSVNQISNLFECILNKMNQL